MKTKQIKDEPDKITDEDVVEPKTRGRKKATDGHDDDKQKQTQDELKTTKEPKKNLGKPKTVVRRRPLGIRKALRSKRVIFVPETVKNAIKGKRRGRRPVVSSEPSNSQEKETVPLIPASEIKREPIEETSSSRSSSPKTAGRRQRLTSDMVMMKSVLGDTPSSLVLGPRTSPYSMRSERSNSPSMLETKNLRSGKPRKAKNNLLNEVVMKEQKKRRRLLSDSKSADTGEATEDCKKLKRGGSCSRDGSEVSKCSDITESDISLGETLNESDSKELNKKLDKPKTELDLDIENSIQISTIQKVPLNIESKLPEHKIETESNSNVNRKKKLSLKRSTSLDSDNNNSNRQILEKLNTADLEEKLLLKTENDTLFEARSSILTSMSKTFNSKEMSKNIRRARRGRKVAAASRPNPNQAATAKSGDSNVIAAIPPIETTDEKPETQETLAKEIDDLIFNLDQNIDKDVDAVTNTAVSESVNSVEQLQTKSVSKFYGLSKPLGDNNSIIISDTGKDGKETGKEKDVIVISSDNTPIKNDDSENIRLHYGDELVDKQIEKPKHEITYKCAPTVASIDKLMDRLKEFEELDKRRQRQEVEKSNDNNKSVMVTNDVVLIPKSGADIKPLKDIQSAMSPEKPIEKENVLSCFENNSAISIVKRDQVRKSIDVDLTNSVTLIKRNSVSARKESTTTKEDAISIFEKSLGKDVTLTEIRKSVDKVAPTTTLVDLHQFATLLPNSTNLSNVVLDSKTISITPRLISDSKNCNDVQITKRKSLESNSRKSSESGTETEEKMATIEKIKSPLPQIKPTPILITPLPVSVKSPETIKPIETEALPAPIEITKQTEDSSMEIGVLTEDILKIDESMPQLAREDIKENVSEEASKQVKEATVLEDSKVPMELVTLESTSEILEESKVVAKEEILSSPPEVVENKTIENAETKTVKTIAKTKPTRTSAELAKVTQKIETRKSIERKSLDRKSTERRSLETQAGPSSLITETPENQKNKENVLRTLGLLTLKAAKEAKIEKLKEKERLYGTGMVNSKNKKSGDYTGTLKTVIKLNRTSDREKKKYRSPLKITFQKSKNRSGKPEVGEATAEEEYYTIERREVGAGAVTDDTEAVPEPAESKDTPNLVIPEKASSFSIHPGRLCMDQCFYCGGKFGLFDTPCHIAQMKSSERQKKVLDNEEKLTIDSCLCDACYRHVDRRANCPSYRKRPVVKAPQETNPPQLPSPPLPASSSQPDKSLSPPLEEESEEEPPPTLASGRPAICHTEGCTAPADRSIRRKWLIKMRSSVNKVLKLECDYPGLHTIPLCLEHHRLLAPLMTCSLCRCSLTKHHNLHVVHHGVEEVAAAVRAAGVPASLGERPVLCKVCRYYVTLLQRPDSAPPADYAYTRKLLQIYNIEVPPGPENQVDEMSIQEDSFRQADKQKRRTKTKNKQRKSTEPEKTDAEIVNNEKSIRVLESPPEKEKTPDDDESKKNDLEEDIESLISSNKIPVPGANKESIQSGEGHDEMLQDMEAPLLALDKQTELQYLLQKQNNPAQFLHNTTNLTQKQKNILKLQHLSGIQKPGQQQRIIDKNSKRIQKIGLNFIAQKEKTAKSPELDMSEAERSKEGVVLKNISLNDECTIESIPNKRQADINQLKNKWQMSESFTQVKKNLSELSKKLTVEKEPKKSNEVKYSNPVKRLETNPSISVRELFPGEEEMNLQCNVEFNNVKGVTPEGWEKCNTMIQYDVETKRLWNELQRPYGNQSSFLRHLILLEKYFRSGDLVLSHSASPTAANYSDSVQSRLRAYDNTVTDAPRRSEPAISLIEFRKKPSINGKSLLKSNQAESDNTKKVMPPPPGVLSKPKGKDKAKSKPLPPELIAINTPKKPMQNVLHNIQQLVKGVTASDPTEVAAAPLPPPKVDILKEKKDPPRLDGVKKTKTTSKPWRPTLMPITQENLAKVAREPTQVAVDGRKLRSLVQVMSSGKQYHITLQDYNKMCIMRMEKLQQQEKEVKTKRLSEETSSIITEIQPSQMLGNGGTLLQNIEKDSTDNTLSQIGTNAATILKNVGLKNITIAPITPKTATVTSQTITSPVVSTPSLLVTSTPLKMPQLGGVSITSEPSVTPPMMMPKIPKSLTVIPQTISVPQSLVVSSGPVPSQASQENRP